jgi:hypothetical protein
MSNLFDLSPEEFSFYLDEGRYAPERRRELIEGYNAAFAARNARPPVPEGRALSRDVGILENARRLGYSALDNLIGFDDDYETTGERFGRGIRETIDATRSNPLEVLGLVSEGVEDSYRRAATLPSLEQIRAGEAPGALDALGFAAIPAAPALGAARAANVLSANPVGRDITDALENFARSREATLSASNDTPFEDLVRMSSEAADARKRAVAALSGSEGGVRLINPSDGRGVAVSPGLSGEEVGKFRLTFIDESRTPTNHVVYNTREQALEEALRLGFTQAPSPRTAALPAPSNAREEMADEVARLLREGRADEIDDGMLRIADDARLAQLYARGDVGADMPMDEPSRMGRAEELGFVNPEFVGSMEPGINELDPRMARGERQFSGSYSSTSPYVASSYADPRLGSVYPLLTRDLPEDTLRFDARGANYNRLPGNESATIGDRETGPISVMLANMGEAGMRGDYATNQLGRAAFQRGLPATEFRNVVDRGPQAPVVRGEPEVGEEFRRRAAEPSTVIARQDTRGVRSRFARFDPRLAGLRNLMAGGAGGALLLSGEDADGPAVQNYRDGGEVMMRSNMGSQLEGGIGTLSSRARDMFARPRGVGTFEQYMSEGGAVGVSSEVLDRLRAKIIEETGTDPFDIAREEGIDPELMLRVIQQESSGNSQAQSEAGAFGYMQLMPGTAKDLGVDRTNPVENMRGGARYLRQQLDEFRTVPLALAAYNAGPGNVSKYGGIPPFKETINYVARITGTPMTDPSLGQTRSQAAADLGVVRPVARPAGLGGQPVSQEDQILALLQQSMPQEMQPAAQQVAPEMPAAPQPQQGPNPVQQSLRPVARPTEFGLPEGASPFAVQGPAMLPGATSILPQSVLRPVARPTSQ